MKKRSLGKAAKENITMKLMIKSHRLAVRRLNA